MNELTHLTHVSLFSGIGGMDIAAERAGFKTVCQCEIDPFCLQVLEKNFPEIPKFTDIRKLSANTLRDAGIECPTILSGGFPCQPYSVAGKRKGQNDDRDLWPEMLRIVQELRPPWVVGENADGIFGMALDNVIDALEYHDYSARAFRFPAKAVGAPHKRYRCFIVANHRQESGGEAFEGLLPFGKSRNTREDAMCCSNGAIAKRETPHTKCNEKSHGRQIRRARRIRESLPWKINWEVIPFPGVCGMDDGISNRVDRVGALGNAVCPEQVFPIFRAIAEIETGIPDSTSRTIS